MEFNRMIPELTVRDIAATKKFYLDVLQFRLEYERPEDKFIFLSFEGAQFMFEEMHETGWNVAELAYPFGRGVNFSIEVDDMETLYRRISASRYPFFRAMRVNRYKTGGATVEQKEFLLQDPDGYLLRFTHEE